MGVEHSVTLSPSRDVTWRALVNELAGRNFTVQLRMIDGLPAFPDEEPPADWRELRAGTPAGMVTLGRTPTGIRVVVWGTDDPALRAAANAFLWAIAAVGDGTIDTADGPVTASEFARTARLPWPGG
jgi:hypothetical protein